MTTPDGISLFYDKRDGAAPALVLIHGWTNNRTVWNRVVEHLNHEAIAIDLRGHGQSDKPTEEEAYEIERFTHDISALLDYEGIDACVIIGYSMGGMIALITEDPRIKGLVLLNTSAGIKDRLPIGPGPFLTKIARFFEEHQQLIPNDLSDAYHNDFETFLRGLAGTSPIATIRCFEEMYDLDVTKRLERINVPTLIIAGERDTILPKRFSKVFERIPKSRLETIDASHFSLIGHAKEVAEKIESFVTNV